MKNAKGIDVRPGMLATVEHRDHMGKMQRAEGVVLFTRYQPRINYTATTLMSSAHGRIKYDVNDVVKCEEVQA